VNFVRRLRGKLDNSNEASSNTDKRHRVYSSALEHRDMPVTFFISASHRDSGIGEPVPASRENARVTATRRGVSWARAAALAGLAALPIFYLIIFLRWHPANFFGLTQDDSIYFSSAKALAQGRGYILPSVPGAPVATKYPLLYPLILSVIWRVDSSFPGNLNVAIALTAAFGVAFAILAFLGLRRLGGLAEWEALLVTAFCAAHPLILYFSLSVLSDVPFAALALAALLVAERGMQADADGSSAAYSGILTGLAILTRMFGIAIATGVIAAAIARRAWRQAFLYCASLIPFCAVTLWRLIDPVKLSPPATPAGAATLGWKYTWTYYTSYLAAWKVGIPNAHVFWAMIQNNSVALLTGPAHYFLDPLLVRNTPLSRALLVVVSVATFLGIIRQARQHGWKVVHFALPCYAAIILFWNYPISTRFLLPFIPLFAAGLWLEGKHAIGLMRETVASKKSAIDRFISLALAVLLAAFAGTMAWNYVTGMRTQICRQSADRAALLEEKRGAYQWLSENTASDAKVIAYEDANVFLYTGRTAMRPLVFTSADFYDPQSLKTTSTHMTDVPFALRADYWLFSDDDYGIDWPEAFVAAHTQMVEVEQVLPLVYRSNIGRVRVYRLN
jgi:hypothetical protein